MSDKIGARVAAWVWPLLGMVLLTAWVCGAAFAFLALLRAIPNGMTVETIGLLSWQFVIVLVAVPVLSLAMIGGLKMLGYAVTIRELLKELPQQVQTFDSLAAVTAKSGEQIQLAQKAMTEAAGTLDYVMSQLADFEARRAQLTVGGAVQTGQQPKRDLVADLNKHLEKAKEIFDSAARQLEEKSGIRVERVRGWILDTSVADLRAAGTITALQAAYIGLALDVDRKTRRSGRANLEVSDIHALDALEPEKAKLTATFS